MTRINQAEHVLSMLRAYLDRTRRSSRTHARGPKSGAVDRMQALLAANTLSEADAGRALVAGLLTEEFGPKLAAEPRFQSMIDDVHRIIDRDDAARALLRKAIAQLADKP